MPSLPQKPPGMLAAGWCDMLNIEVLLPCACVRNVSAFNFYLSMCALHMRTCRVLTLLPRFT